MKTNNKKACNFLRMKEDNWHQIITVTLQPGTILFSGLAKLLNRLGYSTDEAGEVFFYVRQDHVEQWQTDDLVTVDVLNNEKELDYYDDEVQEINLLKMGYLLPWQPIDNAKLFITKVWELSEELKTPVLFNGNIINKDDLLNIIDSLAKDLEERLEPPGGELLAQAIAEKLPI